MDPGEGDSTEQLLTPALLAGVVGEGAGPRGCPILQGYPSVLLGLLSPSSLFSPQTTGRDRWTPPWAQRGADHKFHR